VIEPPEVGAALAWMTLSRGASGSTQQGAVASDECVDDEGGNEVNRRGEENAQGADNVSVHASDGELSASPAVRREQSVSSSSSSSGEASEDGRQGHKIASAVIDHGIAPPVVAPVEAADERRSVDNRRRGVILMDNRRGERADGDDDGDKRKVIHKDGGDGTSARRRRRHGGRKAVSQEGRGAGVHDSEVIIQRNLVRSPVYGDYVPIFSPPPPFPGYGGRSGYVPAVAAW
jgi:hypothetical protein